MRKGKDLTGMKFGRWTVIKRVENNKFGASRWLCKCECGNISVVDGLNLIYGKSMSCGCYNKEVVSSLKKKYNKYDLSNSYGIGWTSNTNRKFYFDLEDYNKIKNYCWSENNKNYIVSVNENGKIILMHRLLKLELNMIDHKNRKKYDNRKENLRETTFSLNSRNIKVYSNNTSGIIGVSWDKKNNKWRVKITCNYKEIWLGRFENIENAIKARLKAELKYFGKEYAPQRHLFKQYGIE